MRGTAVTKRAVRRAGRGRAAAAIVLPAIAALPTLIGGCTGNWYHDSADREVDEILGEFDQKALGDRAERLVMPVVLPPEPPPTEGAAEAGASATIDPAVGDPAAPDAAPAEPVVVEPLVLDLKKTLEIAVTSSREYVTRKESLYLSGLGFSLARFNYGPQFSSAVNYVWGDGDGSSDSSSVGGSFGVSQLLPTNGSLGLSTGFGKAMNRGDGGAPDDWSTSAGISFSQPLLRGAGYDQYRESLTQAERSMVYSVRSFELFRQDFTINTAQQFFGLVSDKRQLENFEIDLETAKFDLAQAEALQRVDRKRAEDVIQARRRRIEAESAVTDARVNFTRQVERFLIDLGLDPKTPVEIVETDPEFESVAFEQESAVAAALANRLDIQTQRDSIEDAERGFRLARDNLLPDLNLAASYGSGGSGRAASGALPDSWSRSASLSLEIPLQTIDRRNAWRSAEISIEQSRRGFADFIDSEKSAIEDALRQLKNLERQLELAEESLADEARNTRLLKFKLESGEAGSRDLIEARRTKINAENSVIERRVQHFIARLRLYRNLGILFIDDKGYWSIGTPAGARSEDGE